MERVIQSSISPDDIRRGHGGVYVGGYAKGRERANNLAIVCGSGVPWLRAAL
jgi:hypothetical protein